MNLLDIEARAQKTPLSRYAIGIGIAVGLHLLPVLVMLYVRVIVPAQPVDEAFAAVEMVRLEAPPEPPSEQPDGKKQVAAEDAPRPAERALVVDPPNEIEPVTVAPPATPPAQVQDRTPAPETTAPASKPTPAATTASSVSQTWQQKVMAHLERYKRYPPAAQTRRQQGVVHIRFRLDREGRVLSSRIDRSSGQPLLDQASLEMLKRAQPLPKPPPEVPGEEIELVVPVEFFMAR